MPDAVFGDQFSVFGRSGVADEMVGRRLYMRSSRIAGFLSREIAIAVWEGGALLRNDRVVFTGWFSMPSQMRDKRVESRDVADPIAKHSRPTERVAQQ